MTRGAIGSWFGSADGAAHGVPALERAARAAASLLRGGDPTPVAQAFAGLIGLGVGLTPSGDDALVGMLAVLAGAGVAPDALRQLLPGPGELPELTTSVSVTALRLAAGGEFSAPVRDVLAASSVGALAVAVGQLRGYGATSGCDTLAGMAAVLEGRQSCGLS